MERIANGSRSTLTNNITDTQTTIEVVSSVTFPDTGNFRIRVNNELMIVTGVSGNTFTVTRGAENTNNVTHLANTAVLHVCTAGSINEIFGGIVGAGLYADRPTQKRNIYLSDEGGISYSDGSLNANYGPISKFRNINFTGYSWVNQSSSTITQRGNYWVMKTVNSQGSDNHTMYLKSIPNTSNYQITVGIKNCCVGTDFSTTGLVLRQSDGKLIAWGEANGQVHYVSRWDSANQFSSAPFTCQTRMGTIKWFRIRNNGTNRFFEFSDNGIDFITAHTDGFNAHLSETQYGLTINYRNAIAGQYITIYELYEGT